VLGYFWAIFGLWTIFKSKKVKMKLDQFLKWTGATSTGGQAKILIQGGQVRVNGAVETRRGRKLSPGDEVILGGERFVVPAFD
jgi:ribosome-associated protein